MNVETLRKVYQGRSILITGHTGFKGAWLSALLVELGGIVSGFALEASKESLFPRMSIESKINHTTGDIRNLNQLEAVIAQTKPEIIFHLAAQSLVAKGYSEPKDTFETNVFGTVNLLESSRIHQSKAIVIVTSDKCYRPKNEPCKEDDPLGGMDPYSASKAAVEMVVDGYRGVFPSILLATARGGNVIGAGDRAEGRLFPDIIRAFHRNKPLLIRNRKATRPFQFVLDPLWGYLILGAHLLNGKSVGAWNFGPERSLSVQDIVEYCQQSQELAGALEFVFQSLSFPENPTLSLCSERAHRELQWKCQLSWQEGLDCSLRDEVELSKGNVDSMIRRRIKNYAKRWEA